MDRAINIPAFISSLLKLRQVEGQLHPIEFLDISFSGYQGVSCPLYSAAAPM